MSRLSVTVNVLLRSNCAVSRLFGGAGFQLAGSVKSPPDGLIHSCVPATAADEAMNAPTMAGTMLKSVIRIGVPSAGFRKKLPPAILHDNVAPKPGNCTVRTRFQIPGTHARPEIPAEPH